MNIIYHSRFCEPVFGITTVMVSHDPSEIYRLASRVLVLENGNIVNDGTPKEIMMKAKNALEGELLALDERGKATVLVGQQLIEIEFSKEEMHSLKIGDVINLATHKTL